MTGFADRILTLSPLLVYVVVALLVFAEDALFVGFVIPGESAAVLGGVVASRGHVNLLVMMGVVVTAAIAGDSVGYEIGRHIGPRIVELRLLSGHRKRLDDAHEMLRRRGGTAVVLGRFVAFFRAVMPALAGSARMPYRRFLAFNAAGGLIWGVGFVLLGYLAGNSYRTVEKAVGRDVAVAVAVLIVVVLVLLRIRRHRSASGRDRENVADGTASSATDQD